MAPSVHRALGIFGSSLLLYLAFAGRLSAAELSLGGAIALLLVALLLFVRRQSRHHFQMDSGWFAKLRSVPGQMVVDCWIVYRAILRRPGLARGSGRFQERDFHVGNEHPAARARRALVTYGISCAPNTYVLGALDPPNDKLLIHQLVPEKPRERDREWPL